MVGVYNIVRKTMNISIPRDADDLPHIHNICHDHNASKEDSLN